MITKAIYSDLDEIYQVFKQVDQNPWSRKVIADSFENENCTFLVLRKENIVAGFAVLMIVADEAELLYIAVLPEFRGIGIGRSLLFAVCEKVRSKGAARLFLEVRAQNKIAASLYESFEFNKSAVRQNYYKNPPEDAILMELIL